MAGAALTGPQRGFRWRGPAGGTAAGRHGQDGRRGRGRVRGTGARGRRGVGGGARGLERRRGVGGGVPATAAQGGGGSGRREHQGVQAAIGPAEVAHREAQRGLAVCSCGGRRVRGGDSTAAAPKSIGEGVGV